MTPSPRPDLPKRILVTLALAMSCLVSAPVFGSTCKRQADDPSMAECSLSTNQDQEKATLRLRFDGPESRVVKQILFRMGDDPWQDLDYTEAEVALSAEGKASWVAFDDMNFDGHPDLAVSEMLPAGPNIPMNVWFYDPSTRKLSLTKAYEGITAPTIDPKTRTVQQHTRDHAAQHSLRTLAWRGDRFETVFQGTCALDANGNPELIIEGKKTPAKSYEVCMKSLSAKADAAAAAAATRAQP